MNRQTIQTAKTLVMGLGIMNIMFGFAMSAYLELPSKIMTASGIAFIAIYFLIWIWQIPETPSKKPKLGSDTQ